MSNDVEAQPLMGGSKNPSYAFNYDSDYTDVPTKNQYEAFKQRDAAASAHYHQHKIASTYL